MMKRIDFESDDAVTIIKLKDGTAIRAKFAVSVVSFDPQTGKYNIELAAPVFQFIKNNGEINLEVEK